MRELRLLAELTQSDLAARLRAAGIFATQPQISRIESGNQNTTMPILRAIALAIGATPDDLMHATPQPRRTRRRRKTA